MLRKFLISLPLMVLLLAGGAGIAVQLIRTKPPPVRKDTPSRPTRVDVYQVGRQTVQETFVGYGTARPDKVATLSAQVGGKIVEVAEGLEDGSEIKKGEVLLRIQEDDYRYQLDRAENLIKADQASIKQIELERGNIEKLIASAQQEVRITQDEYKRVSRLFEKKVAAKREFDLVQMALLKVDRELENLRTRLAVLDPRKEQALASINAHKAEEALAKLNLDRCRIVAPFDGRVKQRLVEMDETVRPAQPLLIALKLDRIEVPIELPAVCANKVDIGNAVTLTVESVPSLKWSGRVQRIGPSADAQSRTITVYVVVDNTKQPKPLLPGLFVRAEVAGPVHTDALVIPRGAVRAGAVFVAAEGTAHKRAVELTCSMRDMAIVARGVRDGDAVILTNLTSLRHEMPVEVETQEGKLANSRGGMTPTSQAAVGMP